MSFEDFSFTFLACLLAIFVFDWIKESVATNVSMLNRMKDDRYNFLAIIYKDANRARLSSVMTDDDIYKMVNEKYKCRSYRFQLSNSTSPKYLESLAFIESVISDKHVLIGFLATNPFDKKAFAKLQQRIGLEEKEKEAKSQLQRILIDKSPTSVDNAMIWMRKLLSEPFVVDPDEADKRIGKTENTFSIYNICKGKYFKADTTIKDYFDMVKALNAIDQTLSIPKSTGHAGDVLSGSGVFNKRKEEILAIIEKTKS